MAARVGAGGFSHGSTGYANGCRCATCREGHAQQQQNWARSARERPVPERVHGTRNGYANYGCRCNECRHANAVAHANWKARDRKVPTRVHGTESGYANYGCRCPECRRANTSGQAGRRARRKARNAP